MSSVTPVSKTISYSTINNLTNLKVTMLKNHVNNFFENLAQQKFF